MNSLCEAVGAELVKAFEGESISDWKVVPNGPNSCKARISQFTITFYMDPRNELISSSIAFVDASEEHKEELYSHIIAKLFPKFMWNDETGTGPIPNRVSLEVENVKNILQAIKRENVSARDLRYFYLGYNSAYGDYLSAD